MEKRMKFNQEDACCGNCAFFDIFKEQKKEDNVLGACHANPPVPAGEYDTESKLGKFPLVLGNFWCGIFQRKEKEKVND